MSRTAHLVVSTHWDREWYEPFQAFRMRLVSMLDEVLDTIARDPAFKTFTTDGQAILLPDYLQVRPEREDLIRRLLEEGRLRSGPWYVLPDEWLVSGESLVRNLQFGMQLTRELGGTPSRAGIVCDQFGHTSQLPQIFAQLGIPVAFVWRGTQERELHGHFHWQAPDGTTIPTYRFGTVGYCTYCNSVRNPHEYEAPLDFEKAVKNLVEFAQLEAGRTEAGPILLFDGGDHLEIEPRTSELIARANEQLAARDIRIVHSDLDAYMAELLEPANLRHISRRVIGELRESGREPGKLDEQWLIPGVLSSRIHLKQRNAQCEDELCLWAEPFSAFAAQIDAHHTTQRLAGALNADAATRGLLRLTWKHLLETHPHDSICGCSIDQVHQDMIYRFDQSLAISQRLANQAMKKIALAAAPRERADGALVLCVFNATSADIDEPTDLEIPLPTSWPKKFQEFFGFEEKFAFKLRAAGGEEIPYQLVLQRRDRAGFRRSRYKFPTPDPRHVVGVTARLHVPAFGYTTLIVEVAEPPTRYIGSMSPSHRSIENQVLRVTVNANGTLDLLDKRTGRVYSQLLTFEDRADIGDGWYHGIAVNDQVFTSAASSAEVALLHDGIGKATLRIVTTMNVPKDFHRRTMTRCETLWPMKIVSEVTLRDGADHLEVATTVDNQVLDHRLRVLFPTDLKGQTYLSDAAFDVVERPVALAAYNAIRKELDVETRPQISWTAFADGKLGLAIVSRGLPEVAVRDMEDRAIALTLFRSFRRAVFSNDNPGGQVQGKLTFRYRIVPLDGPVPIEHLFRLGQRVNTPVRQVDLLPADLPRDASPAALPPSGSFLQLHGGVVVTSVRRIEDGSTELRLFNPHTSASKLELPGADRWKQVTSVQLDGRPDEHTSIKMAADTATMQVLPKRIVTLRLTP